MSAQQRVELTVEEVVLAILHGRLWGLTHQQIAADPIWAFIQDSNRPEWDYPYGVPSTRTLDAVIETMIDGRLIEKMYLVPNTLRVRRAQAVRAETLARSLADFVI